LEAKKRRECRSRPPKEKKKFARMYQIGKKGKKPFARPSKLKDRGTVPPTKEKAQGFPTSQREAWPSRKRRGKNASPVHPFGRKDAAYSAQRKVVRAATPWGGGFRKKQEGRERSSQLAE